MRALRLALAALLAAASAQATQQTVGPFAPHIESSTTTTSLLMDAAGEKVAFVVRIGKTGNIRTPYIRLATVTNGDTLLLSLQNVDGATGDPDGTADQSCTVAVANNDDNTWKSCTLDADRSVTMGDVVALVVEWNSGVGNLNVACYGDPASGSIYPSLYTTSWAKQARTPMLALGYSDGSFGYLPATVPFVVSATSFNNGSTPDERGNLFRVASPVGVCGAIWGADMDGDTDIVLYNSASTAIATASFDSTIRQNGGQSRHWIYFSSAQTLTANSDYRLVIKPMSATNIPTQHGTLAAAGADEGGQVGATQFHYTHRTDAGAWTDVTTEIVHIYPILCSADDATGGSGSVRYQGGMNGGIN